MKFSPQQLDVIHATGDLVVNAVAGAGKTSTLIGYAKARRSSKILYLAFNKSVKEEAQVRFKKAGLHHVRVETAHSLALKYMGFQGVDFQSGSYQAHDAKQLLKFRMKDAVADMRYGHHVIQLMSMFCNSHVATVAEVDYLAALTEKEDQEFVTARYDRLIEDTRKFLGMINKGEIPMPHDFYLKLFQLRGPKLSQYDYILFDEGQDASPVMLDVFLNQEATRVIVGDEHQQIYSWRHAVNALQKSDFERKVLSTSYRFDRSIGDLAKAILTTKHHMDASANVPDITGAGGGKADGSRATLGRSNLAIIVDAIEQLIEHETIESVYFEGHFNSYTYADEGGSVFDVLNLYLGNRKGIRDPQMKAFQDFSQLEEFVDNGAQPTLKGILEIVKKYGRDLPSLIKELKAAHVTAEDKMKADRIYSTVHKAKGMEYDEVTLLGDFLGEEKLKELLRRGDVELDPARVIEDINVLYVAATRTQNKLIIPEEMVPMAFKNPEKSSIEVIEKEERHESEWPEELLVWPPSVGADQTPVKREESANIKPYEAKPYEKIRQTHGSAYSKWTDEQDELLETLFVSRTPVKEIAAEFGRTRGAIYSRIKKLGLQEKHFDAG
ncbi:UvrD-helicase domain-containing protein [Marinoscillum furvescens]|uniref:DNA 3'-5' helicase n=1 Tax=Marinoscillum furvescens DSM 4134 TaxID=1122208 RepID=A0A3D9L947_MARFU|nr:UvrD-helicase domain-containing protein [Marinoscillum furvescens]REE02196.1 superfamily I DNA/RNA helicase [Marinoscillum furvescens DSM 4134]